VKFCVLSYWLGFWLVGFCDFSVLFASFEFGRLGFVKYQSVVWELMKYQLVA
jgi:hypothetical protein